MKFKRSSVVKKLKIKGKTEFISKGRCRKGDIVLVKVLSLSRDFPYIRDPSGNKIGIKKGTLFLGCLSDRYATHVLEGAVPKYLERGDVLHRLEPGGAIGIIKSCRKGFPKTELEFQGFLSREGRILNIMDFSIKKKGIKTSPKLIISIGVDMSSGKTTAAAMLVRGLVETGCKVGAGKITGIGNINDVKLLERGGAFRVYSIIDAGCPSTMDLSIRELEDIFLKIFSNLAAEDPDFIVLEIADGILQRETAMLLKSRVIRKFHPRFVLSCNDALGAYGSGITLKRRYKIVPIMITGLGAITDLGRKEIEDITGIKALDSIAQYREMSRFLIKDS